jgi:hypothetical protein
VNAQPEESSRTENEGQQLAARVLALRNTGSSWFGVSELLQISGGLARILAREAKAKKTAAVLTKGKA